MENLLSLWKVLAQDLGQRCAVDTILDSKDVENRTEREGLSFLTITLPKLGKVIEKWLDQGFVDQGDLQSFSFGGQGVPIFMGNFLRLVFDIRTGVLLPHPNESAILACRQLTGLFGKMSIPASPEKTALAMEGYVNTDEEVGVWEANNPIRKPAFREEGFDFAERTVTPDEILAFRRLAVLLFHRVFDSVNGVIATSALTPKHGPGSTADRLLGNEKFGAAWTWRLEEFFSSDQYLLPNPRYFYILDDTDFLTLEAELPVRVISVPKTQERPRVIGMEPVCMQYAQQAVAIAFMEGIDEDYILKRFLRLKCQEVNQLLAREGSETGALATLDLSEASDRVPNELIRFLTDQWEHLSGAIQACRSRRATVSLGDGKDLTFPINKFASMGSALTFPLESMVFLTCVFVGIERSIGKRLQPRDIVALEGQVAVYGDDIIVPTDHVGSVVHVLEAFGFKVNSQKSFWTGKFRESCGKDYYDGVDVSYVKFRKLWPDDRRSVEEVIALVSFFNQCKDNHYVETAAFLREKITALLGGFFPRVSRDSAILGEWDDVEHDIHKWDKNHHIPLSKGYVVKSHVPANPLDGERALLKFFLKQGSEPYSKDHLQRSGRSQAVSIKLGLSPTAPRGRKTSS